MYKPAIKQNLQLERSFHITKLAFQVVAGRLLVFTLFDHIQSQMNQYFLN